MSLYNIEDLKTRLIRVTSLVEFILKSTGDDAPFNYDDVLWAEDEDGNQRDIYSWYITSLDIDVDKLVTAGIPHIVDNNGNIYIGRTDAGSAWDVYFLPNLLQALNK
jgi:hypothetical protein